MRFEADNEAALKRIQEDFRRVITGGEAGRQAAVLSLMRGSPCGAVSSGPRRFFMRVFMREMHRVRARIAHLNFVHAPCLPAALIVHSVQKILIVRVSSLGDVVHNMPVIADIRRRYPDAQIDWLVEESFAGLVELVDGVRRAIPFSLRRWRKRWLSPANWREIGKFRRELEAEKYDLVIDCQGLIKTAWVASWARGPLVGLANRTEGAGFEWPVRFFYDRRVPIEPRTHVVERTRQLVAAALGLPAPQPTDDIEFGLDTRRAALALSQTNLNLPVPYVVFVHATSRADKQWPDAAWIELGQSLVRRGASIVLPWGSDAERATSEQAREGIRRGGDRAAEAVVAGGGRPDRRRGGDGRRRYRVSCTSPPR